MIVIGCDHAGFELKNKIITHLSEKGFEVKDMGCYSEDSIDYADYAHPVAFEVEENSDVTGILICGSGNGINMSANKWSGVRSALCWNSEIAKMARLHNDANILAMPGRYITEEEAFKCVDEFLNTGFEGGRHEIRVRKISNRYLKNL